MHGWLHLPSSGAQVSWATVLKHSVSPPPEAMNGAQAQAHFRWLVSICLRHKAADVAVCPRCQQGPLRSARNCIPCSVTKGLVDRVAPLWGPGTPGPRPSPCAKVLADGLLYLFAAEALLPEAPPTLTSFLCSTARTGLQTHKLLLRWLISSQCLALQGHQVVQGQPCAAHLVPAAPTMTPNSSASSTKAEVDGDLLEGTAAVLSAAQAEGVQLHMELIECLMQRYCTAVVRVDAIHAVLQRRCPSVPPEAPDAERALRVWLQGIWCMTCPTVPHSGDSLRQLIGDGRLVCFAICQLRGRALCVDDVHMKDPLKAQQKRENWCRILEVGEGLGVSACFSADTVCVQEASIHRNVVAYLMDLFCALTNTPAPLPFLSIPGLLATYPQGPASARPPHTQPVQPMEPMAKAGPDDEDEDTIDECDGLCVAVDCSQGLPRLARVAERTQGSSCPPLSASMLEVAEELEHPEYISPALR